MSKQGTKEVGIMNFQETSNGHFEVHFITSGEVQLFTVVCLPQTCGTFPTVICRSPYVDEEEFLTEDEICMLDR